MVSTSSSKAGTSSSSSSSAKAKKRSKKDKKPKKAKKETAEQDGAAAAAKKAERQRLAAEQAECRRARQNATKTMAKVAPLLCQLETLLGDVHIAHVPKFATEKAKHLQKRLLAWDKGSREILTTKSEDRRSLTAVRDLADVAEVCKEAVGIIAVIKEMLATARKHTTK